jgi:formate/nitrite transporter
MSGVDNYTPSEIAHLVESRGVTKANASALNTLALGVLAGAFIAFGGVVSTTIGTQSGLGFGPTRLLMGAGFSLGLILVVVAGAELFTGNNLIVMSWVSRKTTMGRLLRNWALVYAGNMAGALSVAAMVYFARWWAQDGYSVGATALATASAKTALSFEAVFVRGVAANALVCLAVWLATSGRTVTDKVLAILFPITAFVAAGFEHSVANMYFLPIGMLLADKPEVLQAAGLAPEAVAHLTIGGALKNLAASTLGNMVGGAVLVGLVYWFIYRRREQGGNFIPLRPSPEGLRAGSNPSPHCGALPRKWFLR